MSQILNQAESKKCKYCFQTNCRIHWKEGQKCEMGWCNHNAKEKYLIRMDNIKTVKPMRYYCECCYNSVRTGYDQDRNACNGVS